MKYAAVAIRILPGNFFLLRRPRRNREDYRGRWQSWQSWQSCLAIFFFLSAQEEILKIIGGAGNPGNLFMYKKNNLNFYSYIKKDCQDCQRPL
jgi:hypothetical protein